MIGFKNIAALSTVAFTLVLASPHDVPHRRHAGLHAHNTTENSTHTLTKRFDNARFTWFYPGLGACGGTNGNNDFVRDILGPVLYWRSLKSMRGVDCGVERTCELQRTELATQH